MNRTTALVLVLVAAAMRADAPPLHQRLSEAAIERARHTVRYDPAYVRIAYPGGDVPASTGVCTDEIIRIYRAIGIDLQQRVHEDIVANRDAYPSMRNGKRPDTNIDHRRVPNLRTYFRRHGTALTPASDPAAYRPGDMVTWDLGQGLDHIGMVVSRRDPESGRPMILHNIGRGPRIEDVLFSWKVTGQYRYP